MAKVSDKGLEEYLSYARDLSNGTMPLLVVVEDHQIATSKEWLKGKQKVKELTLMARSDYNVTQKKRNGVVTSRES